jgi:hypothetical protein
MPTLHVSEFSCLSEATFSIAPVNVIIGPQGSGKSVTTKLFYFFADILSGHMQAAERGDSIGDYKKLLAKQFAIWFPPSAWGNGRFNLNYYAGSFSVRILRRTSQGAPSDDVSITFSDWFLHHYQSSLESFDKARDKGDLFEESSGRFSTDFDRTWRVRDVIIRRINSELGTEYVGQQTFIPAGRAFFTSIGRLVAGFEHVGALDPVTVKFARLFASLRDRNSVRNLATLSRLSDEYVNTFMDQLFGGEIKFENDAEFVETPDGRKIPFSSLSSGQQELLPMWSLIDYFGQIDAIGAQRTQPNRRNRELVYIEEPEAHLFPSAQSQLMEFLIGSIVSERNRRSLIITTHSPYIMGKLNVFLKAGQLARRKKRNQDINDVVARECWLNDTQLSAFAIQGGVMSDIIDEDGLIDSTYLDGISEDISRQFSKLLKIESEI